MKTAQMILLSVAASLATAGAQVIPIGGAQTFTENFNTLGSADVPWVDGTTVPGWYAGMNSNTTADGNLTASDGSNGALTGLLNAGLSGDPDRALASKATSTGGFANIAYGVLFQNTSAIALSISNISYTGELWRTNTTAANLEQWHTFYKISPTLFTDTEPGGSSATPNAGTFTALPALNWTSPAGLPGTTQLNGNDPANQGPALSANPGLTLNPGEYFMFRWVDTNIGGTDGHQGIDNISITFIPEPSSTLLLLAGAMGLGLIRTRR